MRPDDKPRPDEPDDRDRMIAATERLAELLSGAGPSIVVTPVGISEDDLPQALRRAAAPEPAAPVSMFDERAINPLPDRRTQDRRTHDRPDAGGLAVDPRDRRRRLATPPANAEPTFPPNDARQTSVAPIAAGRGRGRIARAATSTTTPVLPAHSVAEAVPRQEPAQHPSSPPPVAARPAASPAQRLNRLQQFENLVAGDEESPPKLEAPETPAASPERSGMRPDLAAGGELADAMRASRRAFVSTGIFSFVINILMLAGPLFMLQVYDRVLASGSMSTLIALSVLTAAIYGIIGVLELVRSRIVTRIGAEVDGRVGDRIFDASLRRSVVGRGAAMPALRELDTLRQFLASPGPLTFFDAPWTPVYLLVVFMLHWTLGVTATLGALVLFALAMVSEARSRTPLANAGKSAFRSIELAESGQRNAEAIMAMGMQADFRARWQEANRQSIAWQIFAADRLGTMSAASKTLRLLMQSLMLAIGAALAIYGHISAGAIVAGTIIFGRALAPVEQAIGHWRQFLKAREAYEKLDDLLKKEPPPPARTALPPPKGHLAVAGLRVAAPDTRNIILNNLNFEVAPGQMLAVIGPSASGKSTLVRTLVGLWPPIAGHVKIDGARIDQWPQDGLGRYVGYLPQSVELFAGTVRENIARFRPDASDTEVVAAAEQAFAHEMILALPDGYDTELGAFGTYLSAGQRQRIGLARALFRNPALVVLDEPNSNLDRVGDEALTHAINGMRKRGQTIVLVSHRVQAITIADLLLYVDRGTQRAFGQRDDVMRLFMGQGGQGGAPGQAPQGGAPRMPPQPGTTPPGGVR